MASKTDRVRKIDLRKDKAKGNAVINVTEPFTEAPPISDIPAPEDLVIDDTEIQRSTQAPLARAYLSWLAPNAVQPNYYIVEYSTDNFATNIQRQRADVQSAIIENLKVNTLYYFRVQAVVGNRYSDYSNTVSDTMPVDNTAPPDVSNLIVTFVAGDLIITWNKPVSETYKDAEITIKDATQTITYGKFYNASQRFVWLAEQNKAANSGVPVTSVHITIKSRSWNNVLSTGITDTATSSAPDAPVPTHNWSGDIGLADEDLVITWPAVSDANNYAIVIDGVTYSTQDLRFIYRYDRNVSDHSPTLKSGDPNLTITMAAKNKLNQLSTNAAFTAINAAPSGSLLSLQASVGFSQIAAYVTASGIIQDFSHYNWTLLSGSTTLQRFNSTTPDVIFQIAADGTYSVKVAAVDKFNQSSTEVIVSGLAIDTLTIEELRAQAIYTDSVGNSAATLAVLKDNSLVGTSVSYSGGVWHWIQVERPTIDRYGVITVQVDGTTSMYFALSEDGTNWTYYAGLVSATGLLTSYGSTQASAQAAAIAQLSIPNNRVEIPSIKEARYIRMYHTAVGTHTITEFYPRRLVESDDIKAETIQAINIATGAITANKISVINLQAVSANMGALHMDGVIDIVSTGGIYQGTGTFASPTTGLKIYNSSGVGKISGYNAGVEQVSIDTDGKFKAGAGAVILDENGVRILGGTGRPNKISYYSASMASNSGFTAELNSQWISANLGAIATLTAFSPIGSNQAQLRLTGEGNVSLASVELSTGGGQSFVVSSTGTSFTGTSFTINSTFDVAGNATITSPVLSLVPTGGTATVSNSGASANTALKLGTLATGNRNTFIDLVSDATYTTYGLRLIRPNSGANSNSSILHRGTGTLILEAEDAGSVQIRVNGNAKFTANDTGISFFPGVTPVARQTGGAATADLTWSANEVSMLNTLWTMARNYGLLT